jgi:hypothetical protein
MLLIAGFFAAMDRVQFYGGPRRICDRVVALGQVFLRAFRISRAGYSTSASYISVIRGWYRESHLRPQYKRTHKGMVRFDMSKPALIFFFFFTARVHTTKSTVKILAANTH